MGGTRGGNCAWLSVGVVVGAVLMLAGVVVFNNVPFAGHDTPVNEVPAQDSKVIGVVSVPSEVLVEEAKPGAGHVKQQKHHKHHAVDNDDDDKDAAAETDLTMVDSARKSTQKTTGSAADTDLTTVDSPRKSSDLDQKADGAPPNEDKMTPRQILDWAQAHSTSNEAEQAVEEARAAVANMQDQFQTAQTAALKATTNLKKIHKHNEYLETTELVEAKPQVTLLDDPELMEDSASHYKQQGRDESKPDNLKVLVLSKEEESRMTPSQILKWAAKHAQSNMAKAAVAKAHVVLSNMQTDAHGVKTPEMVDEETATPRNVLSTSKVPGAVAGVTDVIVDSAQENGT